MWVFQKAEIALTEAARASSAFWKNHSCKLIQNWTRNRVITYTYWFLYVVSVLSHRAITKHCPNCNLIEQFRRERAWWLHVLHGPLGAFARRLHDRERSLKETRLIPRLGLEDEGSEECAYCSNNTTPFCINGFSLENSPKKICTLIGQKSCFFCKRIGFL